MRIFHYGGATLFLGLLSILLAPSASALTSDTIFIGHARGYSSVRTININTGREGAVLEFREPNKDVLISPDGRNLVWDTNGSIFVTDHATEQTSTILKKTSDAFNYHAAKFLPDGKLLYTKTFEKDSGGELTEFWTYSFQTRRHVRLSKKDAEWFWGGALSQDGKYILLWPKEEGSVIKNTKFLLKSPSSTKEISFSTGTGKTNPEYCNYSTISPKSIYALTYCSKPGQTYYETSPIVIKTAKEGYQRGTLPITETPAWISDGQFIEIARGHLSKTDEQITIMNMGDADPDFSKTIARSTDYSKRTFSDVLVQGNAILYIEKILDDGKLQESKLVKYDLKTGKTTLVLKGKPKEKLSLQPTGSALVLGRMPY